MNIVFNPIVSHLITLRAKETDCFKLLKEINALKAIYYWIKQGWNDAKCDAIMLQEM